jgi:hypothetical protein
MKLLIDVPDDIYASEQYCDYFSAWSEKLSETFRNGTPLPKWHGRLIDESDLIENLLEMCDECGTLAENPYRDNPHIDAILDVIENTDTIIPADITIVCPNCGIEQYKDKEYCMDCGAKME